jgi:hypothetical protein
MEVVKIESPRYQVRMTVIDLREMVLKAIEENLGSRPDGNKMLIDIFADQGDPIDPNDCEDPDEAYATIGKECTTRSAVVVFVLRYEENC